jgi:hypothetical protein
MAEKMMRGREYASLMYFLVTTAIFIVVFYVLIEMIK